MADNILHSLKCHMSLTFKQKALLSLITGTGTRVKSYLPTNINKQKSHVNQVIRASSCWRYWVLLFTNIDCDYEGHYLQS